MKPLLHDCLLEDILEFSNGKSLPNSFYDANAKYPVWGSNGIIAHCDKFLTIESVIVIGRVGAYCGSLNLVDGANWVTDNAIYAIPKPGNDIRFLYYLLISLDISRTAIGSAQPLLTQSGLKAIKCKIPPLETQREIAHILGTLDDKIELNCKISKTLEEMAQTLYKHWFIDFEFPNDEGKPYKSSGGEMIDSELGPIPKGWRVGILSDEFDIIMGQSPPGDTYNTHGEGLPFYQGNADFGFRYPKNRVYCSFSKKVAKKEDALLSVRAPVGDLNKAYIECIIGRGLCIIRHRSKIPSYGFYMIDSLRPMLNKYNQSGTLFSSLAFKSLSAVPIIIPYRPFEEHFNSISWIFDQCIRKKEEECYTLVKAKRIIAYTIFRGDSYE